MLKGGRKSRLIFLGIFVLILLAAFFDFPAYWDKATDRTNSFLSSQNKFSFAKRIVLPHFINVPFRLGLDLQGGTHLVYQADLSQIEQQNSDDAMQGVRDVIERRVNAFGVAEPLVQINKSGENYRLIVDLAGIKDIKEAIKMIGETPSLDFREEATQEEINSQIAELGEISEEERPQYEAYLRFKPTNLTGKYLKKAEVVFNQNSTSPEVSLEFDDEGSSLFEDITGRNIGKLVAIYLDGYPISTPRVNDKISGGRAVITGTFNVVEARELAQRLNAGALPVPISLISQQTVGPSLGIDSLNKSIKAGLLGLLFVIIYMIVVYRLLGLFSAISLLFYSILVIFIFKIVPVTMTLSGIAGFIMSIGVAADANILIFERFREEIKGGKSFSISASEAFHRAWPSIRDSNISTLLTCLILFWFGTGVVKGFSLTLSIGILVSLFSAMVITKLFLRSLGEGRITKIQWLWTRD